MTWSIIQVQSTLKTKLSCRNWLEPMWFVTKIEHDNNVTDCTSAFYVENDTKLLWLIEPNADCDENQIRHQRD